MADTAAAVAPLGKHMVDGGKSSCIACWCIILVMETSKGDERRNRKDAGTKKVRL